MSGKKKKKKSDTKNETKNNEPTIKEQLQEKKDKRKALEAQAEELALESESLGYDISYDGSFDENKDDEKVFPKAQLTRPATVGDGVRAELMARRYYGVKAEEPVPDFAVILARLCLLVKFDGKLRPLPELEGYDPDFLGHVSLVYARHLSA